MQAIREYTARWGVTWTEHADAATCGFYDPTARRCRIYAVRPYLCRAFGVIVQMTCPYFPLAARQSLPGREMQRQGAITPGDRLLAQEFAPDGGAAHIRLRGVALAARR